MGAGRVSRVPPGCLEACVQSRHGGAYPQPSIWETETRGPGVQRQSELCSEFEASWAIGWGWGWGEISDKNLSFFELCTDCFNLLLENGEVYSESWLKEARVNY